MECALKENAVHDDTSIQRESVHSHHENSVPSVDLQPLLRAAIEKSGVQHKVVAACVGASKEQFSEMLAWKRPLSLKRLESVPIEVQRVFSKLYAEALDWTVTATCPLAEALADQQAATARVQMLLANRRLPERSTKQVKAAMEELPDVASR